MQPIFQSDSPKTACNDIYDGANVCTNGMIHEADLRLGQVLNMASEARVPCKPGALGMSNPSTRMIPSIETNESMRLLCQRVR
jgi:hypothetical protein